MTMDLRERVGHMLVLGTTRVGKTRLAEVLITQDIRRGISRLFLIRKGMRIYCAGCGRKRIVRGAVRSFMFFTWAGLISVPVITPSGVLAEYRKSRGGLPASYPGKGTARRSGSLPGGLLISLPGHWLLWGASGLCQNFTLCHQYRGTLSDIFDAGD